MRRLPIVVLIVLGFGVVRASAADDAGAIKRITIRAPRDMGYFAGDLVKANIDIVVDDRYVLEEPSLPHAGPIAYWLDLRSVGVESRNVTGGRRYTLDVVYQNFYDALDSRPQEIPSFPVTFTNGKDRVSANVPAWTIGVSSLREIAPPIKSDPKDYLRPDGPAPYGRADPFWWSAFGMVIVALLALALLARDRAWWPFRSRPKRAFAESVRKLKVLARRPDRSDAYMEALVVLHRSIDRTDGQRVLADDLPVFLERHPPFRPMRDAFSRFFTVSRSAFFGRDPARARADLDFVALQGFARRLAAIERTES